MTAQLPAVTRIEPGHWLRSDAAGAMDFLNGVAERFPGAVSLAAGRPPDALVAAADVPAMLRQGVERHAARTGIPVEAAWRRFGQYADTNGMILPALARLLERTEAVDADGLWIQVTNGIQEALLIECLRAAAAGGAAIAFDPAYVGMAGAAATAGLPLYVTARGAAPVEALAQAARVARRSVRGPLLCYVIADHDNPTGESLGLAEREALLEAADEHDLLLLEDSAYRLFNYDEDRLPSLLSLDRNGRVVHLASFSKTFMPGLRVGFTARSRAGSGGREPFATLTSIKSFASVLTAPLAQAAVAGFLAGIDYDLDGENEARRAWCRRNRDVLHSELQSALGGRGGVDWRSPAGGFFLTVDLPFEVSGADAVAAAERHGVLVVPMQLFSPTGTMGRSVRLSFSSGDPETIAEGARRFAQFVEERNVAAAHQGSASPDASRKRPDCSGPS